MGRVMSGNVWGGEQAEGGGVTFEIHTHTFIIVNISTKV